MGITHLIDSVKILCKQAKFEPPFMLINAMMGVNAISSFPTFQKWILGKYNEQNSRESQDVIQIQKEDDSCSLGNIGIIFLVRISKNIITSIMLVLVA